MPQLVPVDGDPFAAQGVRVPPPPMPPGGRRLTPVDHDPFARDEALRGELEADVPGARITSTYRNPVYNAAVGGAAHSLHMQDAAVDFNPPPGMTREQAMAAIRARDPHPRELMTERGPVPTGPGAADHIHYAPSRIPDLTPVDHDPFAAQPAQGVQVPPPRAGVQVPPPRAGVQVPTPKLTPVEHDPFGDVVRDTVQGAGAAASAVNDYLGDTFARTVNAAGHQVAQDFREDAAELPNRTTDANTVLHPLDAGGLLRFPREVWDVAGAAASPFTGAYDAAVARPVGEIEHAIAGVPVSQGEGDAMLGMMALGPEGGRVPPVEQAAEVGRRTPIQAEGPPGATTVPRPASIGEAAGRSGPARTLAAGVEVPPPDELVQPHPDTSPVGNEHDPAERIDNALYRLGGQSAAGRVEALHDLRDAPPEVRDPKVQEELTHAVEQKMINPLNRIPDHLQAAEDVRRPWAERQRIAINSIRQWGADHGWTDDEIEDFAPSSETGYVPRRPVGSSPGLDPREGPTARKSPLAIDQGPGKRSLTRTTSSMKARTQIVLEDAQGARRFEHRNPDNEEWKPGMQVRDPLTGQPATVRPATIKEVEAAGARDAKTGELIQYHKNALVNTIDEALRAERVYRNLQVLDEITHQMADEGLAHRNEWRFRGEDGLMNVVSANTRAPEGFVELPNIPQLRGWSFDPKVAEVPKDYFPGPEEPLDSIVAKINRAMNASLFITPFPHIKNVATMGFVGRGWDWLPTAGNYRRLFVSGRDAIKEVVTLGPRYRRFLREGAGLQAADDATRNFYQKMLDAAGKGIEGSPQLKRMGVNPVEWAKALYGVSHKILWNVNDMVLLQRQFELEAKGMATRDAIKEAERWIANYRIPSQVLKSRAAAQLFKRGDILNFGRYTYGKWRALGEMVKGLTTGSVAERTDALGKVVALGVLALFIYPMMDQMAKMVTGNKNARFTRGGELGPVDALTEPGKSWIGRVSGLLTPAPLLEAGAEGFSGHDLGTGQNIVEPTASPGKQAVQAGEWAAGRAFYPAQEAIEATKDPAYAGGRLIGLNLPQHAPGEMKGKTRRYLQGQERRRERQDPLERLAP